ncbi:hypothetical protein LOK49_LG03G03391 [Camellia lanceoleosa]|uniref:Uncharacterized protein n=1 Tax=Camellia lanceoleosa TaxID=1840588 RepID=A0ACC0IGK3_9ERIC|nr:hypothetical protein LOK49_LG03G03391 [Camellia lanceoleosa]
MAEGCDGEGHSQTEERDSEGQRMGDETAARRDCSHDEGCDGKIVANGCVQKILYECTRMCYNFALA